jgi:hypothetical protein
MTETFTFGLLNQMAILGRLTALAPGGSVANDRRSRQFQIA